MTWLIVVGVLLVLFVAGWLLVSARFRAGRPAEDEGEFRRGAP